MELIIEPTGRPPCRLKGARQVTGSTKDLRKLLPRTEGVPMPAMIDQG
jgi:hypothetical protein